MKEIIEFFRSGGVFMYPLALLSIVTISIVIERLLTEMQWRKHVLLYLDYLKTGNIISTKIPDELKVNDNFFHLDAKSKEVIVNEKIQLIFDKRIRLNEIISAIGNTAPLLGFIGTVSGMVHSFGSIASADNVSIKLVASGISEALITTGYGLIVAAVCIITESMLRFGLTKFLHKVEYKISDMMDQIAYQNKEVMSDMHKSGENNLYVNSVVEKEEELDVSENDVEEEEEEIK